MTRPMRVEVFERKTRGYYRLRAGNGEIVMQCAKPKGYSSRSGARRAAKRLAAAMKGGPVEVVER